MPIVCQCPGTHGRQYDKITKDLSCCMFLSHSVIVSCLSFIEKQFFGSLTTMGLYGLWPARSHCIIFFTSQYQMMVNFITNEISTVNDVECVSLQQCNPYS